MIMIITKNNNDLLNLLKIPYDRFVGLCEIKLVNNGDILSYIDSLDKNEEVILCNSKRYPYLLKEIQIDSIDFNKLTKFNWYNSEGFVSGKSHLIRSYISNVSVNMNLVRYKMIDIDLTDSNDEKVIELAKYLESSDNRVSVLKSDVNNYVRRDSIIDLVSDISGVNVETVQEVLRSLVTSLKLKLLEEVDCNLESNNLDDVMISVGDLGYAYFENNKLVISDVSNNFGRDTKGIQNSSIEYLENNLIDRQVQRFLKRVEAGEVHEW